MNRIGSEGAKEIALALYGNSKLKKLALHGNRIGTDPAKMLAAALYHNETLRCLNISANPIGEEAVKSFACVISQKGNLVDLNFDSDLMPPILLNEINSCLKRNSFRSEEREMGVIDVMVEDRQKREMKETANLKRRVSRQNTCEQMDRFFI